MSQCVFTGLEGISYYDINIILDNVKNQTQDSSPIPWP